jgi:hypothetical protein
MNGEAVFDPVITPVNAFSGPKAASLTLQPAR